MPENVQKIYGSFEVFLVQQSQGILGVKCWDSITTMTEICSPVVTWDSLSCLHQLIEYNAAQLTCHGRITVMPCECPAISYSVMYLYVLSVLWAFALCSVTWWLRWMANIISSIAIFMMSSLHILAILLCRDDLLITLQNYTDAGCYRILSQFFHLCTMLWLGCDDDRLCTSCLLDDHTWRSRISQCLSGLQTVEMELRRYPLIHISAWFINVIDGTSVISILSHKSLQGIK